MMTHIVMLPQVIEQKLKVPERKEVIDFVNEIISDTSDEIKKDVIEIAAEKFERRLSSEILNLKMELVERIVNTETKLTEKIASMETRMAENKAEIIKWIFIFWIGNVITIIGAIAGILKITKVF
jgi:hypothetical protein